MSRLSRFYRTTLLHTFTPAFLLLFLFACGGKKADTVIPEAVVSHGTFLVDIYEEGEVEALRAEKDLDAATLGKGVFARHLAELMKLNIEVSQSDFTLRDMCGPGYAVPSADGNAAVRLMAELEGIFLDPVYTGKAFAGLIQMAKEGRFKSGEKVLFIHTGGAGGLFAVR